MNPEENNVIPPEAANWHPPLEDDSPVTADPKLEESISEAADQRIEEEPKYLMDGKGKPLVFFRGSSLPIEKAEYNKEHLGHSTGAPSASEGFFFTNRKATARYYSRGKNPNIESALRRGEEPHIDSVNLAMDNPYIHDFKGRPYRDISYNDVIQKAKEAGHDGVILKNTFDSTPYGRFDAMMNGHFFPEDIYVVFEPKQIKVVFREKNYSDRKAKKYGPPQREGV